MKEFSLKPETICDFYVDEQRKKVWKIELDLLNKLTEVCNKNNIRFFADAGTLLGAVRHKGFIPWDDDIDVAMLREDYEKLIKLSKDFEEPYFLQSWYTEKGYYRGHAQLRNSETTAILKSEEKFKFKFNQGIFIDIFVLDSVPNDEKELKIEEKKMNLYNKFIFRKFYYDKNNKSLKNIVKLFINSIINIDKIYLKKENLLKSYDIRNNENIAPLGFIFETKKRIRNKHLYDEVVWLDFENTKIPCPKDYDKYLKCRYGKDYMIPQNIPTTHGDIILDTEKSYKDYIGKE